MQKVKKNAGSNHIFLAVTVFITALIFSLNTYYFYQLNFPLVQIIGLFPFLALTYATGTKLPLFQHQVILVCMLMFYIVLISHISIYVGNTVASPVSLIGVLIGFFVFLISYNFKIDHQIIHRAISGLATFLLVFWFFQFVAYYVFDRQIDFFIDVVGYEQRTLFGLSNKAFFRPSSLFVEPAMYANSMLMIFFYRFVYNKSIIDKLSLLIIFTIIFTFSTYGHIAFMLILVAMFVSRMNIKTLFFIVFCVLPLLFLNPYDNLIIDRIFNPFNTVSGQDRIIGHIFHFVDLDICTLLFGFGWGNAEVNGFLSGQPISFLIYNIGFVGTVIFFGSFLLMINKVGSLRSLVFLFFVLVLLNSQSVLTSFFFWFMLGIVFSVVNKHSRFGSNFG